MCHKDHTTQQISHERFIGNYTEAASERGCRGKREKQKTRDRETDRVRQTDRQTGNMKAGRDGRDLLKGMYVAFGSW